MMAMNRPSQSDYKSLINHIHNREPLLEAESTWANQKEDLVTLRIGREHAWLDSGIEKLLKYFHCGILEVRIEVPAACFLDYANGTKQSVFGDEVCSRSI
jgi:hypothetical protein